MSHDTPAYQPAPVPPDEPARLAELHAYRILDTPPERAFDDLTALASSIAGTPIALVSLIDAGRQWFKSRVGLDSTETPRDIAFCAHAILGSDPLVVEDATRDPRFAGNPDVVGGERIRFYAGTPLESPGGHRLGTLCVIDRVPRTVSPQVEAALSIIARQVVTQLELRKAGFELREQSARLAAMSRMKDEFVSIVSHELRTPLTAIKGSLQLLIEGAVDDEDERAHLQAAALSSAERLIRLVNDILDVSKIEAGALQLRRRPVDVRTLVDTAVQGIAEVARAAGVGLRVELDGEPPTIDADADRVVQALVNLMSNAVKVSAQGKTVVIGVARDGAGVRFDVRDEGPGIPADSMDRLFRKFSQLDSSDARRMGGTGLGLVISQGIVEQHGGRIDVSSRPGAGSTFTIHLPSGPARSVAPV